LCLGCFVDIHVLAHTKALTKRERETGRKAVHGLRNLTTT
jgi:hypothetical protein